MLPASARLTRRDDFALAVRRGRRVSAPGLVLHAHRGSGSGTPLVGFIVGRSVGGAVARNQVRRRLRHVMAGRLDRLPAGCRLVVRATPASAGRSSVALAGAIDTALAGAIDTALAGAVDTAPIAAESGG